MQNINIFSHTCRFNRKSTPWLIATFHAPFYSSCKSSIFLPFPSFCLFILHSYFHYMVHPHFHYIVVHTVCTPCEVHPVLHAYVLLHVTSVTPACLATFCKLIPSAQSFFANQTMLFSHSSNAWSSVPFAYSKLPTSPYWLVSVYI